MRSASDMSAGRDILSEISHQLGRRFTISDLDLASGTFRLSDRSGSVAVTLEPDLLVAFYEQLSETEPPGLDDSRPDEQRQVLNGYVVTWVAELLESDSRESLTEILLLRDAGGRIYIEDRRDPLWPSPSAIASQNGQYWSPDPPAH